MTEGRLVNLDVPQIVRRFPGHATIILRLALRDVAFREICEDYTAARASLAFFAGLPDFPERPEVAEFRHIIEQLEQEIAETLRRSSPT